VNEGAAAADAVKMKMKLAGADIYEAHSGHCAVSVLGWRESFCIWANIWPLVTARIFCQCVTAILMHRNYLKVRRTFVVWQAGKHAGWYELFFVTLTYLAKSQNLARHFIASSRIIAYYDKMNFTKSNSKDLI
jgi:hypothetical protein